MAITQISSDLVIPIYVINLDRDVARLQRELHRSKRDVWAAMDIIHRFPSHVLGWRRVAFQENAVEI